MQVKSIRLVPPNTGRRSIKTATTTTTAKSPQPPSSVTAWIIDDVLSEDYMEIVNDFRVSLPLDAKRPTVKRRFFSSALHCPAIREGLITAIQSALQIGSENENGGSYGSQKTNGNELSHSERGEAGAVDTLLPIQEQFGCLNIEGDSILDAKEEKPEPSNNPVDDKVIHPQDDFSEPRYNMQVHVLAYMRFLEYDTVGGHLDPHTDGNKICEDTNLQSTHTMLLYLRDCDHGGETLLLEQQAVEDSGYTTNAGTKKQKQKQKQGDLPPPSIVEAVQPKYGRILLFPHPILHEGAPVVDVPKLCLRAEVALYQQS